MLLYGATEMTAPYREECDVAARVEGESPSSPAIVQRSRRA
jgi:hypothetical protein